MHSRNDAISYWRGEYLHFEQELVWNRNSQILILKMRIYTEYNEKLVKDNEIWLDQIAKMDENPVFKNIPTNKTIAKIVPKEVNI